MIGRMVLVDNGQGQAIMKYVKGPLAEAMEKGYLFILMFRNFKNYTDSSCCSWSPLIRMTKHFRIEISFVASIIHGDNRSDPGFQAQVSC